jgi:hypothetical protein
VLTRHAQGCFDRPSTAPRRPPSELICRDPRATGVRPSDASRATTNALHLPMRGRRPLPDVPMTARIRSALGVDRSGEVDDEPIGVDLLTNDPRARSGGEGPDRDGLVRDGVGPRADGHDLFGLRGLLLCHADPSTLDEPRVSPSARPGAHDADACRWPGFEPLLPNRCSAPIACSVCACVQPHDSGSDLFEMMFGLTNEGSDL